MVVALYAAGYFTLQEVGLLFIPPEGGAAVFWPAAGWALAFLVASPVRLWPALLLAQVVVNVAGNLWNGFTPAATGVFAVANLLEPLIGAAGVRWVASRFRDRAGLSFASAVAGVAVLANCMVAAAIGAAGVVWVVGAPVTFLDAWSGWWASDAVGIVALAPFLVFTLPDTTRWPSLRWVARVDRVSLVGSLVTVLVALFVFMDIPVHVDGIAAVCLLVPGLLFTAMRGAVPGIAVTLPGVVLSAAWFTAEGHGPFSEEGIAFADAVFDAQIVIGSFALVGLFMGSAVSRLQAAVEVEARTAAERASLEASTRAAIESGRREQRRRELAEALQALTGGLTRRLVDVDEVLDVVRGHLAGAVRARGVVVWVDPQPAQTAQSPTVDAAVMRDALMVEHQPDGSVVAGVPLHDHEGRPMAVVEVRWAADAFDGDAERALRTAATTVDQAVQRASLFAAERRASEVSAVLRFTAERLSTALSVGDVAARVVDDVVPLLGADAAWCAVNDTDGRLRVIAASGSVPAPLALMEAARSGSPGRSRRSVDGRHIVEPLRIGREVQGVLALGYSDRPTVPAEVVTLVGATSNLVAQAMARARLYDAQRSAVLALQEALLPSSLDSGTELAVTAEYRPGSDQLAVGGDWYDVIPRADGRVAVIVGDVVGRGVSAAAVMGQLRAASAALATLADGPADLLTRLEAFAATVEGGEFATVVAAIIDPIRNSVTYSCAGHPPPVLVGADGGAELLMEGRAAPLCGLRRAERTQAEALFDAGSTLLLYTDGLVERRGEVIDEGLGRLLRAVATAATRDIDALVGHVLDELAEDRVQDDLVLLAVRPAPRVPGAFIRLVPARLEELAGLRKELRAELAVLGVTSPLSDDVLLSVGEAVANAIEHGYCGRPVGGAVQVMLWRAEDGAILASVRDFGQWQGVAADGPRGRGLGIMQALGEVTLDRTSSGTSVRLRFPAPAEVAR